MDDPFIGMIAIFGFNFAPRDWAFCSGQVISISQNPTLYSLIGCAFGGDCRSTFGYPDLRSRVPLGSAEMGLAPFLSSYARGTRLGTQLKQLGHAELPTHNHGAIFAPSGGGSPVQVDISVSAVDGNTGTATDGALLSQGKVGFDPANIFQTNPAVSTVGLGGVTTTGGGSSGGTVAVLDSGLGNSFSIQNPVETVNYAIAEIGLYPSRN